MDIHNNSSSLFKSFKHAFNGLIISFKTQRNIKIEISYFIFTLCLSIFFRIGHVELFAVMCSIILVIITELLNTSIEFLTDLATQKKWNNEAKEVKDIAASAVLVSAIFCIIVHLIVFIPHIIKLT